MESTTYVREVSNLRCQGRLNRLRTEGFGNAKFVARMGAQCVMLHQLPGHLTGQLRR